jgi:hypothetical protein
VQGRRANNWAPAHLPAHFFCIPFSFLTVPCTRTWICEVTCLKPHSYQDWSQSIEPVLFFKVKVSLEDADPPASPSSVPQCQYCTSREVPEYLSEHGRNSTHV